MPSDIRSFFGGGGPIKSIPKEEPKKAKPKGRAAKRVIEDSDSDEVQVVSEKKPEPKKATPKKLKKAASPIGEATTTSDYFGKAKPKRSEAVTKKANAVAKSVEATPKATPVKSKGRGSKAATTPNSNGRSSARKKKPATYVEINDDDFPDDLDDADDIMGADFKTGGRKGDDYEEGSDNEVSVVQPKKAANAKSKAKAVRDENNFRPEDATMKDVDPEETLVDPEPEERISKSKPAPEANAGNAGRKRKSTAVEDDEEDMDVEPPKKSRAKPAAEKKSPVKKKAKKEEETESAEMKAIMDSIPTVRPPTPPSKDGAAKPFKFGGGGNAGPPPAPIDSSELPQGADNCLAGLTFVFTGLLQRLQREEAQNLVKRYGGKVTGAPSKKTSFVVLGTDAGPKKLQTIKDYGLKTIDEDGLFALIKKLPANGGDSKAAAKFEEKQAAELKKIKEQAAAMEKAERKTGGAGGVKSANKANGTKAEPKSDSRLWTVKYAPNDINQICGNKTQVEKLQRWLRNFPKNQKHKFKLGGADGSGTYRAVMIHGPPGIGKTTAAHLVAKIEGYDVVESNASDTRSKKLVEQGLKGVLETTSLLGYFAGDNKEVEASKKKLVLIMDEVDGMSAGDRGGVGALAAVCKKSQIPMILICNDRRLPKMKPFDFVTYDLPFRRPTVENIRARMMTIAYREGLKMPPPVMNALIEGTNADIRQVINMLSTAKVDDSNMDFDQSKQMSKAWEKHIVLKPWDIIGKILGGGMFAASSKSTLNDKTELYFNDHEFSYLMMQENYLGTNPTRAGSYHGKEKDLKMLELIDQAAESISDGDLIDRMIHGSQQQWSLMPTHAIFSFVRPASFVAGSMAGHKTGFTQWLGKNSSQQKFARLIKEIQGHMRLRSSGDRHEIRQQYVPVLWTELVKRLERDGKEAVPEVIDLMDSYFLTKEDFDAIQELGVGPMDQENVKIETQVKSTFTRMYNAASHPLPFMKASNVLAPKKGATKDRPDIEDVIEESDEGEVVDEAPDAEDDDLDLSKDKYVKQPKKKAAGKAAAKKPTKKRAKDEDDEESEEEKPAKKAKGKAAAKGKGKK